jgi:ribosomal protein S18 acetylase RimI-like enzyme
MSLVIAIAGPGDDPAALAGFFCANLSRDYISHSELQSNRTGADGNWSPGLAQVITRELAGAIAQDAMHRQTARTWNGVVTVREAGRLCGLAILLYSRDGPHAYGVIEDVVIDGRRRGAGLGTQLIEWVLADMRAAGLTRVYLESGVHNIRAHSLFEKLGFETTSIVMTQAL